MGEDPIDARETELGPSSGGLELFVRCVNDRTCFVALPRSVADAVARRNPRVPLPLALAPRKSPTHSGERRSNSTRRGDAADASPAQSSPLFVAGAGAVGQVEGHVEIPLALADCLGLRDGDAVRVSGRPSAPTASFVNLRPETEQDWEAVVAPPAARGRPPRPPSPGTRCCAAQHGRGSCWRAARRALCAGQGEPRARVD